MRDEFKELKVNAEIQGRPKHFYSIYSKISTGRDFSTIYDLTAIRIIVDTVKDCYAALGAVHAMWTPLPGRFKDYIAMPKPNMYQSLHTTVVGPSGDPLEIQIRTWEMHRTSEYCIAAHWRYKEGGKADQFENKLSWLRALLEWQKDMRDSRVFMENLKLDLFDTQVFVFSPRGDVYSIPAGGTPLDFAYQVHTDVGNHCVGAKVNGRIVRWTMRCRTATFAKSWSTNRAGGLRWTGSPSSKLRAPSTRSSNGSARSGARRTSLPAKSLEQELARAGLRTDVARGALLERIAARLNYASPTDLYAAIGFGDASAQAVANRVREEFKHDNVVDLTKIGRKPVPRKSPRRSSGVRIAGVDDVMVRLSKCCSPVPGDPIIGYVTIGRGVSVHRADCPNVAYMNATPERILQSQWLDDAGLTHGVDIEVEADDRSQLVQDIMAVFAELKTQVSSVNARVRKDGVAVTSLTVQIRDLDHLHKLLTKLETLKNVRRVYRVTKRERTAL